MLNKRRPAKAGNYTLCRRRISLNRQKRGRTVGETEEEKKKKESSGRGKEQKKGQMKRSHEADRISQIERWLVSFSFFFK